MSNLHLHFYPAPKQVDKLTAKPKPVISVPVGPWKLNASTSITAVDQNLNIIPRVNSIGGIRINTANRTGGWLFSGNNTLSIRTPEIQLLSSTLNNYDNNQDTTYNVKNIGINTNLIVLAGTNNYNTGSILTTTDGINISTIINHNNNVTKYTSVAYGNGLWVAGSDGLSTLTTSPDAKVWTPILSPLGSQSTINTVAYGNSLWVAGGVGQSTLATSLNGSEWTPTATNPFGANAFCTSVAYGNNVWVAGGGVSSGNMVSSIATSTDGLTWNPVSNPFVSSCTSVVYGSNLWVASGLGQSTIATSLNGSTWNPVTSPFGAFVPCENISYGNGVWIATRGTTGNIARSSNAINWTMIDIGNTTTVNTSVYANFVTVPVPPSLTVGSNTLQFTPSLMQFLKSHE